MKLGSWLIARGKITGVQLKRALLDQSFYGGYLSSSLMKLGYLDESTLGSYLSEVFRVPYAGEEHFKEIASEVVRIIPEHLAQKHQIVPLAIDGKKLRLAMMNPADILVMDEVAFLSGLQIEPCVSSESHLLDALERYYQLPPSVRETIPLADQVEGRQNPLVARRQIMEVSDAAELPASQPAPAHHSENELGLDGRPLSASAEAVTEFYPGSAASAEKRKTNPVPRSLDEWREDSPAAPSGIGISPGEKTIGPASLPADAPAARIEPTHVHAPQTVEPAAVAPAVLAAPPRRPVLSLVPTPSVIPLEQTAERLKIAATRDEVFEAVLDFCSSRFARCAIFLVTQTSVVGFGGRGEGFDPAKIRAVKADLETPSIFSYFRAGNQFYFGPVPGFPANQQFYRGLDLPIPERILLLPVHIKDRLIGLVYGDFPQNRREEPDLALYKRLVQKAVLALEILILRNKIGMV